MTRLMDLKIDFAFKKVFGKSGNEPILIAFLNAALNPPLDERIKSVEIMNGERNRDHIGDRMSIMDILAKTEFGTFVNIEIQLANEHNMDRRTLYYWAGVYLDQMKQGMAFQELKQTVTINIVNFRYIPQTDRYHTKFRVKERTEGFGLTDVLEVHFMELPKLMDWWEAGKANPEENLLARWLLLLEADDHEDIRERLEAIAMENRSMGRAFEQWEEVSMDDATWNEYRERRKALIDESAKIRSKELWEQRVHETEQRIHETEERIHEQEQRIHETEQRVREQEQRIYEREQQFHEEEQQALEREKQTLEQGIKQGYNRGIQEGIKNEKREMVKSLIAEGASVDFIKKVTGLPVAEIEELREEP